MPKANTPLHVSVGNFNIDVAVYVDKMPGLDESVNAREIDIRPGGAATNYAVAVSHYGHRSSLIASVSNNPLAKMGLETVRDMGVDVSHVSYVDAQPGMVVSIVYPDGSRSMIRSLGANAYLTPDKVSQELLDSSSVVHMATLHPAKALEISRRTRAAMKSYDPGVYVHTDVSELREVLRHIDVLFLNRQEYAVLTGEVDVRGLFNLGVNIIVVKLGGKGAVALTRDGGVYHAYTAPQGKPVDTTGAGDAFNAFFNAAYIDTGSVREALRYGASAGALKTLCKGSMLCWDRGLFKRHLEASIVEEGVNALSLISKG